MMLFAFKLGMMILPREHRGTCKKLRFLELFSLSSGCIDVCFAITFELLCSMFLHSRMALAGSDVIALFSFLF